MSTEQNSAEQNNETTPTDTPDPLLGFDPATDIVVGPGGQTLAQAADAEAAQAATDEAATHERVRPMTAEQITAHHRRAREAAGRSLGQRTYRCPCYGCNESFTIDYADINGPRPTTCAAHVGQVPASTFGHTGNRGTAYFVGAPDGGGS